MVLYFHTPDWRDRREEGGRERRKHTINVDLGGGASIYIYIYIRAMFKIRGGGIQHPYEGMKNGIIHEEQEVSNDVLMKDLEQKACLLLVSRFRVVPPNCRTTSRSQNCNEWDLRIYLSP